MKNQIWHLEPHLDEENWSRWPGTECCTIASSKLVLLIVYFLRFEKQRFHGTIGKNRC